MCRDEDDVVDDDYDGTVRDGQNTVKMNLQQSMKPRPLGSYYRHWSFQKFSSMK